MKKRMISLALILALALGALLPTVLAAGCPVSVDYNLMGGGVSADLTSESVASDAKPSHVPTVLPLNGKVFLGWSTTKPVAGKTPTLVDPATVRVTGDTTFYAVYKDQEVTRHDHFVIGYPDGTFQPEGTISRAEVATIIARAVLTDFVEGADYGNPGKYTDTAGHWARSAIDYCAKYGVMKNLPGGSYFYPNQPITREELAYCIAQLDGIEQMGGTKLPFPDIAQASDWALDGIYTAYIRGYVRGDSGTNLYRPRDTVKRAEAVTLFNTYLKRGVDAAGLADMKEYVHTGVASNNTENGYDEYMTWTDVTKNSWYYYDIIEAANDHEFYFVGSDGTARPEKWTRCFIDEKWRYGDNPADNGGHSGGT